MVAFYGCYVFMHFLEDTLSNFVHFFAISGMY
jgi:hypothetical protein